MSQKERGINNLHLEMFVGDGEWDIPELNPCTNIESYDFIPFSKANTEKEKEKKGVHFFLDDFQFLRVWNNPDMQIETLRQYNSVSSPNFSLYTDFPKAMQLWNHYRNQWCGAYWQEHGINVIPCVTWSDEDSYKFCFDGHPKNSKIIISTVGTIHGKIQRELFKAGFKEMEKRLKPTEILLYGKIPEWLDKHDIIHIGEPDDRF